MRITVIPATVVALMLSPLAVPAAPKTHELKASTTTVHRGFFDASLPPVLTVDSGDIVKLETASGNPKYYENLGVPKEKRLFRF